MRARAIHVGLTLAVASMTLAAIGAAPAPAAEPATYRVQLDAQPPTGEPWAFLRMFPGPQLTVHRGDIVRSAWESTDTPHTSTFINTDDPNTWRNENQGPGGPYAPIEPDSAAGGDDNELIINPSVANPSDPACGTHDNPCTFDGSSIVNSGLVNPNPGDEPSTFTRISAAPGTYSMLCLLHPGMQTLLKVVGSGASIPSPKDVVGRIRAQAKRAVTIDGPIADARAQSVSIHNLGGGHARWTINGGGFFKNASANEFVDSGLTIHVGDELRIDGNFEIHTATFPAGAANTVPFIIPECEVPGHDTPPPCNDPSTFRLGLNNKAINPSHSNVLRDPAAFRNSGLLPDPSISYTFLAKKPGTYTMVCLVHGPEMSTSITVED